MTGQGGQARAIDVVAAYLSSLDAAGASRPLRRQRAWALREALLHAAARRLSAVPPVGSLDPAMLDAVRGAVPRLALDEVLGEPAVAAWTRDADRVLRGGAAPNAATQRARVAAARALAGFAAVEAPGHRQGAPVLRGVLERPHLDEVLAVLVAPLPGRGPDDHVRLAAVLAVMSVWPARSAELATLRVAQLGDEGSAVTLDLGDDDVRALSGVAAERLRAWLVVRSGLVGALDGGPVHALWVSIRSNRRPGPRGPVPAPPGMPLRPRGLQRAYARSVDAANRVHAGRPGFPVPRSLDLLRRSLAG